MASQSTLSVSTSAVAVVAPQDCLAVTIQQQQGSAPPAPKFSVYATDGVTVLSTQQPGTNFVFNAAPGTKFSAGQVVGYVSIPTGTVSFTVFADPVVAGQSPPGAGANTVTTVLTSAQLLALQTTAIKVAPAPPMGFFIKPRTMSLQYKFKTGAYTIGNADNAFQLEYAGKSASLIAPAATGLVDQTADTVITQEPSATQAAIARTGVEGLGLELKLAGTTPALTVGAGSVIVTLTYDTVSLQ